MIAKVPHGHWKTTTFVGGLRLSGFTAPLVIDGRMNGKTFLAYVEQQLAPALLPGDVVVMDHLPSQKVAGVRQAIESVGARVVPRVRVTYQPPHRSLILDRMKTSDYSGALTQIIHPPKARA